MEREPFSGELGWTGNSTWEAIHADWPAYPGDESWELALLRFGDFPLGTEFICISVTDQVALFVANVGINESDLFSEKHMHVAVRLKELLELDERGLVDGVEVETDMSPAQVHLRRSIGPDLWARVQSGAEIHLRFGDGKTPFTLKMPQEDEYEDDGLGLWSRRIPELVALYEGRIVKLTSAAAPEVNRLARLTLEIPSSLQDRLGTLLGASLFDTAIRDLGAALESRMRAVTGTNAYGRKLVEQYIDLLQSDGSFLPARLKSLRQEIRSIFKFVRNEFAHQIVDLEPSRGYALVSRLCWHIRDVELIIECRE